MIILHCTKKLLDKINKPLIVQDAVGDDDWYANLFRLGRKQSVIFTHAKSLYSFVVPSVRKQDLMKINQVFILELEFQLKRDGFPHKHNVKLLEKFWDIQIGKTINRSTVGSMNDMVSCAKFLVDSQGCDAETDIAKINHSINTTPFKAIGYKFPIECFAEMYKLPYTSYENRRIVKGIEKVKNETKGVKTMDDKILLKLTPIQREVILEDVSDYILDIDIERAISAAISKNGKYHIYLPPDDLEDLIGNIYFVANHEEKNKNLVLELDELIDYLECILDECK